MDKPIELQRLVDVETFREVCRSFSELYGIGIHVLDGRGKNWPMFVSQPATIAVTCLACTPRRFSARGL